MRFFGGNNGELKPRQQERRMVIDPAVARRGGSPQESQKGEVMWPLTVHSIIPGTHPIEVRSAGVSTDHLRLPECGI